jgi:NADPH:quinone reductase-like Zn-dependent oxidoreductase
MGRNSLTNYKYRGKIGITLGEEEELRFRTALRRASSLAAQSEAWRRDRSPKETHMKAIVCTKYGPPEVLQLKEVENPTPRKNEVCIKIFATAVTASDCIIRGFKVSKSRWILGRLLLGLTKPRKPILGLVLAGGIETRGKDVKRFQTGDRVYAFTRFRFGAYAQYTCLPEDSVMALHFLRKGNIRSGQKVLIYGASGAVGTSAVQLARHFGAEIAGVCGTTNVALVKALGADTVIDYTQEDVTIGGELYDLIFDAVGKRKSSKVKLQCKMALTPNGKYISVDDGSPKIHIEDLHFLTELIEAGQIKAVIDRCYPLEYIVEAHSYVETGHKKGNVVITVAHNSSPK